MEREVDHEFPSIKREAMKILGQESELEEIVRLVGIESLYPPDRLVMKTAKIIRQDFLHQNAFHDTDAYTAIRNQYIMLECILFLHRELEKALQSGVRITDIERLEVEDEIARIKYVRDGLDAKVSEIKDKINKEVSLKRQSSAGGVS